MIDSPAVLDTCPRCGAPILDAHSDGLHIRADAAPLDGHQELAALMDGRLTWDVQPLGLPRKPFLHYRHSFRIAGERKWPVVQTHRCPPGPHTPRQWRPRPVHLSIPSGPPIPDQPQF